MGDEPFSWARTITSLLSGVALSEDDAAAAMTEVMEGAATPAQVAGFVIALRAKGETSEEIAGLVRAMRSYASVVEISGEVLDTCGTGGDRAGTFNVSTAAAIVCAGAGAVVAKHGNRAASSRSGSADVLEALGVKIDLPPDGVARCIREAGIGFCFAPVFHPAMRHTATPRRELGVPTVFNFLGPLTNPAGAKAQALGVADPKMLVKMVETLRRLGSRHVVAFHGTDGLDELSTIAASEVVELRDGDLVRFTLDPRALGLPPTDMGSIAGGSSEENAQIIREVLAADRGPRRDIVVLNAAAGLLAADVVDTIEAGLERAREAIDDGSASAALDRFIEVSNASG